jgi:hypothetical protein
MEKTHIFYCKYVFTKYKHLPNYLFTKSSTNPPSDYQVLIHFAPDGTVRLHDQINP